jgi:hypothetical protein
VSARPMARMAQYRLGVGRPSGSALSDDPDDEATVKHPPGA